MKLAIISDIHDNLANLEKFLDMFKKNCSSPSGEQSCGIICCGDVTTPETLEWLVERFTGPIKLACGNMEIRREEFAEVAGRHKNLAVFPEIGEWNYQTPGVDTNVSHSVANMRIAFAHKPDKTEELARSGEYNFVFYGHTHKPWIVEKGKVVIANPGTLGGVFTTPTFATLDVASGQLALIPLWR